MKWCQHHLLSTIRNSCSLRTQVKLGLRLKCQTQIKLKRVLSAATLRRVYKVDTLRVTLRTWSRARTCEAARLITPQCWSQTLDAVHVSMTEILFSWDHTGTTVSTGVHGATGKRVKMFFGLVLDTTNERRQSSNRERTLFQQGMVTLGPTKTICGGQRANN